MAGGCPGGNCGGSSAGASGGGSSSSGGGHGHHNEGTPGVKDGPPVPGCIEPIGLAVGAVSWDPQSMTCITIQGYPVTIADTVDCIEGMARIANFNMHVSRAQPAVPNQFSLPSQMMLNAIGGPT